MRLYSFGNMYLQGIQAGIQCQHCTVELFTKYLSGPFITSNKVGMLKGWAEEHKTTILLNGGNQRALMDIMTHLDKPENPYPYADFVEDLDSLNGALTNVSIIIPEKIYMYSRWIGEDTTEITDDGKTLIVSNGGLDYPRFTGYPYTQWELELIKVINSKRLMG